MLSPWQRPLDVGVAVGMRHAVAVDVDMRVDTDGDVAADRCETMPEHISYDAWRRRRRGCET